MDEMTVFVQKQPLVKFAKDTTLVYQGEVSQKLYAIRSGYVKIYDLSVEGNEQLLGLACKYDFLPSEALFVPGKPVAKFFYSAFTPVEAYVVDRQEFLDRIRHNTEALYQIAVTLHTKYSGLMQHLNAVQRLKARDKIVYVLYFLANDYMKEALLDGAPGGRQIGIPLTQQDIANLVGVTRETAAHELQRLKQEGLISYNRSTFMVHERLVNLVN